MNVLASRRLRAGVGVGAVVALVAVLPGSSAIAQTRAPVEIGQRPAWESNTPPDPEVSAAAYPFELVEDRDVDDRLPVPEDRYALAGGCYRIEVPGAGYVVRDAGGLVLGDADAAVPLHLQATRLGTYLLATDEGPDTSHEDAWWDVRGYVSAVAATPDLPLLGALPALPALGELPLDALTRVAVAARPSRDGEWELTATGDDPDRKLHERAIAAGREPTYHLTLEDRGRALGVQDGALTLVAAEDAAPLVFRHLPDDADGRPCATWPEIETGADGRPAPTGADPSSRVEGFFEAHVHGMAYEFIGGELRCGQPWHPYGVEHALGNCVTDGQVLNSVLEVPLAGKEPTDPVAEYDPVGWPTFGYWPQHDTLTHEQFYYRWLERAHLGGLRLMTNLLVDNTALCQLYPLKRNSCNEMDGVRLQAQRLYELQDYIDAQSGGPGEGWLRIVTSPAQARETIHAGRLAVVMGIEVSVLFDCNELAGQAQCTEDDIDERLQEVVDLGVRQMEMVNKFDNALTGVTGDGGTTGIVVNVGNRFVTGHFWDMQACPEDHSHDHGDEFDRTQLNLGDELPEQTPDEIDQLAARILGLGGLGGYGLPLYGPGPHCNTRGLTDLGAHLIRQMVAKGVIFDPDHMSALAQRQALDLIEDELITEPGRRGRDGRTVPGRGGRVYPGLMSSHSWANEVIYQRIYELDGVVAPRTDDAAGFADRWTVLRDYARRHAPPGYDFGLGYGADTNGLGAQPGPRTGEVATRIDYDRPWQAPIGGVTLGQQVSGVRAYDINTDGVAHYGLFADWFREVQLAAEERHPGRGGGQAILRDMLNGAEQYLTMWERAAYGGNDCVVDGSMPQLEDIHALLGLNLDGFLRAIGAPVARDGDAFVYCAQTEEGGDEDVQLVEVSFDGDGTADEVTVAEVVTGDPAARAAVASTRDLGEAPTGSASTAPSTTAGAPATSSTGAAGTEATSTAGTIAPDGHVHAPGEEDVHTALARGATPPPPSGAGLASLLLACLGLVAVSARRLVGSAGSGRATRD